MKASKKSHTPKIVRLTPESAKRMGELAASFPCLRGTPGVEPFDMVQLLEETDAEQDAAGKTFGKVPEAAFLAGLDVAREKCWAAGFLASLFEEGCDDNDFAEGIEGRAPPRLVELHAGAFNFHSFAGATLRSRIVVATWLLDPWWPEPMAPVDLAVVPPLN